MNKNEIVDAVYKSSSVSFTEAARLLEEALKIESSSALYWEDDETENLVHTDTRFHFNYDDNKWWSEEICMNQYGSSFGIGRGKKGLRIPLYLRMLLEKLNNPKFWDIEA